jgi:hypothetical protein
VSDPRHPSVHDVLDAPALALKFDATAAAEMLAKVEGLAAVLREAARAAPPQASAEPPAAGTPMSRPRLRRGLARREAVVVSATPVQRWTTRDVADFLQVHVKTVHHYRKVCGLPSYRLAGVRFDPTQVVRWLKEREEGGT